MTGRATKGGFGGSPRGGLGTHRGQLPSCAGSPGALGPALLGCPALLTVLPGALTQQVVLSRVGASASLHGTPPLLSLPKPLASP